MPSGAVPFCYKSFLRYLISAPVQLFLGKYHRIITEIVTPTDKEAERPEIFGLDRILARDKVSRVASSTPSQLLVEVTHLQVEILLPVKRQHLLRRFQRHPLETGSPPPPVEESVIAGRLVALPPSPQTALGDPEDLRCLHQVMHLAIARKITSWTFIARSTAVAGYSVILPLLGRMPYPLTT